MMTLVRNNLQNWQWLFILILLLQFSYSSCEEISLNFFSPGPLGVEEDLKIKSQDSLNIPGKQSGQSNLQELLKFATDEQLTILRQLAVTQRQAMLQARSEAIQNQLSRPATTKLESTKIIFPDRINFQHLQNVDKQQLQTFGKVNTQQKSLQYIQQEIAKLTEENFENPRTAIFPSLLPVHPARDISFLRDNSALRQRGPQGTHRPTLILLPNPTLPPSRIKKPVRYFDSELQDNIFLPTPFPRLLGENESNKLEGFEKLSISKGPTLTLLKALHKKNNFEPKNIPVNELPDAITELKISPQPRVFDNSYDTNKANNADFITVFDQESNLFPNLGYTNNDNISPKSKSIVLSDTTKIIKNNKRTNIIRPIKKGSKDNIFRFPPKDNVNFFKPKVIETTKRTKTLEDEVREDLKRRRTLAKERKREEEQELIRMREVGEIRRKKLFDTERKKILENRRRFSQRRIRIKTKDREIESKFLNADQKNINKEVEINQPNVIIDKEKVVENALKAINIKTKAGTSRESPIIWASIKTLSQFIQTQTSELVETPLEILMAIMQLTEFINNNDNKETKEGEILNMKTIKSFVEKTEQNKLLKEKTNPINETKSQETENLYTRILEANFPEISTESNVKFKFKFNTGTNTSTQNTDNPMLESKSLKEIQGSSKLTFEIHDLPI